MATPPVAAPYPVRFDVDYPESLDRATTLLRLIWVIPIAIVLGTVGGASSAYGDSGGPTIIVVAGGILVGGPLLMIVFGQKYPRWWFDWNLELARFSARVASYVLLLRDEYPSTDDHQAVHLEIDYPNVEADLNRWLPLVKWFMVIPHYVVLFFLVIAAFFAVLFAWFAILFTGRYPRGLFDFVVGVQRWCERVGGYMAMLVTDRYPPFSLR